MTKLALQLLNMDIRPGVFEISSIALAILALSFFSAAS